MFDTNPTWINEGATLVLQAEQALGPLSFKHWDVEEIVPKRWNLAIQKPRQPGTGLPTQLHLICISEYGYAYVYIEYHNINAIKKVYSRKKGQCQKNSKKSSSNFHKLSRVLVVLAFQPQEPDHWTARHPQALECQFCNHCCWYIKAHQLTLDSDMHLLVNCPLPAGIKHLGLEDMSTFCRFGHVMPTR